MRGPIHPARALRRLRRRIRPITEPEAFDRIYARGTWDQREGRSFSGPGSTADMARPYEEVIVPFLQAHDVQSVLDYGCGDFQVSARISERMGGSVRFHGYDISKLVIEQNRAHYPDRFTFLTADDDLPAVDAATARQVLQHVRFRTAQDALDRLLDQARFLIVAEHVDAATGENERDLKLWEVDGTRRGIYVDRPPFNLEVEQEWLLPWESDQIPGYLRVTVTRGKR